MRIAILHPGAMGAAVGAALVAVGHEVVWLPEGRSAATAERARAAGLTAARSVESCETVLSIVPPAAAIETARAVAGFGGIFVDANAIAPQTAAVVAELVRSAGDVYVDGGIIGGPPAALPEPSETPTRLYLSGADADRAAEPFAGSGLEAVVLEGGDTAASALKMAYGAWTKESAALLLAVRATAEHWHVGAALDAEWARSQPELAARVRSAWASAESKGWRWVEEMRQNALTFDAAGQPTGFGEAAAEVFGRHPRPE